MSEKGTISERKGPWMKDNRSTSVQMLCMEGDLEGMLDNVMSATSSKKAVLKRTLDILIGLSLKGYEGKPVGAIFLIGDIEGLRRHTSQMIINPFKGWRDINILDEKQRATFEAFCQLDGALILDHRGYAHFAGRMIHVKADMDCGVEKLGARQMDRDGTGTRARASRYITERTKTVAVSLSHSGEITLFERGKDIGRLTRKVIEVRPDKLHNLMVADRSTKMQQ